ncbi:hypothetical protein [Rhodopila sp.]|uniref:hypothetical protein n=1 Tax=Rhodopila sp. TaxID=2480087 RepID=UPI003D0C119E
MGQIIRLPVRLAGYPDNSGALDPAESVLLIAVRSWVDAYRQDEDPMPRLCQSLDAAGVSDAAFSVGRLMTAVAGSAVQPMSIHRPSCRHLSNDEKRLLHAASLAQSGHDHLAETALRAALLSAEGAAGALDPLLDLAGLLGEAGMFFRRRRAPATDPALDEPTAEAETIH